MLHIKKHRLNPCVLNVEKGGYYNEITVAEEGHHERKESEKCEI